MKRLTAGLIRDFSVGSTLVVILALSFLILFASLSEPESGASEFSITQIDCRIAADGRPGGQDQVIALPHSSGTGLGSLERDYRCAFDLSLTADEIRTGALLIPAYADRLEFRLNGRYVADPSINRLRNLRFVSLPAYFSISQLAQAGKNHFELQVSSRVGRNVLLDRIYIGSQAHLYPVFKWRWFLVSVLPTMESGAALGFGVLFGVIWWSRRQDAAYGWLAVLLLVTATYGSTIVPDFLPLRENRSIWSLASIWEITANLFFVRRLLGLPKWRNEWLLFFPPLLLTPASMLVPDGMAQGILLPAIAVFFLYFLLAIWFLGAAVYRRNLEVFPILLTELAMLAFCVRDILVTANFVPSAIYYGRSAMMIFLLSPVLLMFRRFSQALTELDRNAESMRQRVSEVEAALHKSYEELRERREAALIGAERARLMRDLHDGMGGEVATMLALAEAEKPDGGIIADHARAALTDMRLIVSSLEDYGGELSMALGAWRERVEPQVRAAGFRLGWDVKDLPCSERIGPAQILDVLRILQEAVTNAVRHSGGTRLWLVADQIDNWATITVSDDGSGMARAAGTGAASRLDGKGLLSMRQRADRLHGELSVDSTAQGVRVTLRLQV